MMKQKNLISILTILFGSFSFAAQPLVSTRGPASAPVAAAPTAQAVAPSVGKVSEKTKALLAENELNKKKSLESITKMMAKITELKKYRDAAVAYYKNVEKLSHIKIWRKLCNVQVQEEVDAENPLAAGKKKTKEEIAKETASWFECVDRERDLSIVNLDTAMMSVAIGNEQVKNAEEALATTIKYYNVIPGVQKLAVPLISPYVVPKVANHDVKKKGAKK